MPMPHTESLQSETGLHSSAERNCVRGSNNLNMNSLIMWVVPNIGPSTRPGEAASSTTVSPKRSPRVMKRVARDSGSG